ncbi:hypothetical protein ACIQ7Q_21140 [Streptomyces sp. NPDC096176]|uniref:hypothetical protein n=1 Tax=Streptomyces sp. NPDC096176 TaxID=3366079 RepID=UPI0037FF9031
MPEDHDDDPRGVIAPDVAGTGTTGALLDRGAVGPVPLRRPAPSALRGPWR